MSVSAPSLSARSPASKSGWLEQHRAGSGPIPGGMILPKLGVLERGEYPPNDQYDHQGGRSVVEELERLNLGLQGVILVETG